MGLFECDSLDFVAIVMQTHYHCSVRVVACGCKTNNALRDFVWPRGFLA